MRIPRIYSNQPLSAGQSLFLEEGPSRHIAKVLRMQAGRELVLFNGQGGEYQATIAEVGKKQVTVCLGEYRAADRESPLQIELAIGLSRGERFDWVLQKATELGVTRILPLLTERTEVKLSGDRLQKKLHHWQQIAVSACEQCQRNRLPQIAMPLKLTSWLTQQQDGSTAPLKLVLHHRGNQRLAGYQRPQAVTLLIGPEGGLSEEEIQQTLDCGFQALTLGPRVLRTETAPVVGLSLIQYLWGDL